MSTDPSTNRSWLTGTVLLLLWALSFVLVANYPTDPGADIYIVVWLALTLISAPYWARPSINKLPPNLFSLGFPKNNLELLGISTLTPLALFIAAGLLILERILPSN